MVFYEQAEFSDANNTFNCPVVSGYPDVIRSAIDPQSSFGIPLDMPAITFRDPDLLNKACTQYLTALGVQARRDQEGARSKPTRPRLNTSSKCSSWASRCSAMRSEAAPADPADGAALPYRPAHQPQHCRAAHRFWRGCAHRGLHPIARRAALDNRHVMTQWEYLNRYFHAARWVGEQENVELVQLNSFGCGPDAFILDEVRAILAEYGKRPTVIRIDEIEFPGSIKLRLRSMLESLQQRTSPPAAEYAPPQPPSPSRRKTASAPSSCRISRRSARRRSCVLSSTWAFGSSSSPTDP